MQRDVGSTNTLEYHDAKRFNLWVRTLLRLVHKFVPQTTELMPEVCQRFLDIEVANQFQRLRGRFTNVAPVVV